MRVIRETRTHLNIRFHLKTSTAVMADVLFVIIIKALLPCRLPALRGLISKFISPRSPSKLPLIGNSQLMGNVPLKSFPVLLFPAFCLRHKPATFSCRLPDGHAGPRSEMQMLPFIRAQSKLHILYHAPLLRTNSKHKAQERKTGVKPHGLALYHRVIGRYMPRI